MQHKFMQDDDCHWYMIPTQLEGMFYQLLENGEADCYSAFIDKFDSYRCNHPSEYTFENPEEV